MIADYPVSPLVLPDNVFGRYAKRPSWPVYGWWYYFMLYGGVGKSLGQLIPKFPPTSDEDIDALLAMKVRM